MEKYLYCNDEILSTELQKNLKLLNVINGGNGKVYVFRYNDNACLDFSDPDIKKSCMVKDKLYMCFNV